MPQKDREATMYEVEASAEPIDSALRDASYAGTGVHWRFATTHVHLSNRTSSFNPACLPGHSKRDSAYGGAKGDKNFRSLSQK